MRSMRGSVTLLAGLFEIRPPSTAKSKIDPSN
jgi:hypothetical protein